MMDPKMIWSKFIMAQEKILESKSYPIATDEETLVIKNNRITIDADPDAFKKALAGELAHLFKIKEVDLKKNHLLQDLSITENISSEALLNFKQKAASCYINFNENPVIEGEILPLNMPYGELIKVVGDRVYTDEYLKQGALLLTLEEYHQLQNIPGIIFNGDGRARIPARPPVAPLIRRIYPTANISETRDELTLNGELHPEIAGFFNEHFGLSLTGYELRFTASRSIELQRTWKELSSKYVLFPKAENGILSFDIRVKDLRETGNDLSDEYYRLSSALSRYFPGLDFTFEYVSRYQIKRGMVWAQEALEMIDDGAYYNQLGRDILPQGYQLSVQTNAIFFDFEDAGQLSEKVSYLKGLDYLDFNGFDHDQRYRFSLRFDSGITAIESLLKSKLPDLTFKLEAGQNKLTFRKFYRPGDKLFVTDQLRDKFSGIAELDDCAVHIHDSFLEKYLFEESAELRIQDQQEHLLGLKGEDFYFNDKKRENALGKLTRVNYPRLEFTMDNPELLPELVDKLQRQGIYCVIPNLKGETDKILRLTDTIRKLGSDIKLPNDNAKQFLFDARLARKIDHIEDLLSLTGKEWLDFENNVYSKRLNLSQKQAVFKSLHAPELALIQGPPGTGKSTAIAEVIWQHVRSNQRERILLTSETNLAVDNAIDRLKNDRHNLVKPIRFGSSDKLESEGRFYSLDAIEQWVDSGQGDQNAVAHWINNITGRVATSPSAELQDALTKWQASLKRPNRSVREVFADRYITNANLIGATGSSIGKLNSEGKYTSFFRSYLSVFNRREYAAKNWKNCNAVPVYFDTVVMDEASKATPPELALPVLFARKSIIVGDHRQLPPMVDGEEIKDVLKELGESALANSIARNSFAASQFESLFERIDPSIKGTFNIQYRMHPAINNVIAQFYVKDGGLQCGLPLDESGHLSFENPMSRYHGLEFPGLLTPETHVVWIDVDAPEIIEGTSRANFGEIKAIANFLKLLKMAGGYPEMTQWLSRQSAEEKEIGIISFYGKQVNYLEKMLAAHHSDIPVRLSTVDRFQGMERNIIIVSMVRSNCIASDKDQAPDHDLHGALGYARQPSLGFAESPNRLNVALSRARRLLVIVGNKDHFSTKRNIQERL
jgi:hypothetical protein